MKANNKLKECLMCKNRFICWGVDPIYESKDHTHTKITWCGRVKLAIRMMRLGSLRDFQVLTTSCYVNSLLPEPNVPLVKDIVQTSCMVTDALVNTSYDGWECSEDLQYVPIRGD